MVKCSLDSRATKYPAHWWPDTLGRLPGRGKTYFVRFQETPDLVRELNGAVRVSAKIVARHIVGDDLPSPKSTSTT
jgi:hypothetical protein